MLVDHRIYFPLVAVFVGVLAVHDDSRGKRERDEVTSVPSTVPLEDALPTASSSVIPTESASGKSSVKPGHSTKSPRHHHGHSFKGWDDELYNDSGANDWDYMEDLVESSPGLARILQQEKDRHQQENPRMKLPTRSLLPEATSTAAARRGAGHAHGAKGQSHAHAHSHVHTRARQVSSRFSPLTPPHSWAEFCDEAAAENVKLFRVSDGSLHPLYEMVPGVGVYRLHARARSWEAARKVCEREGAQLAVPNSRAEALALMEIHNRCPRLLDTHFNDYQYLGVHDLYSEGNWETVVGDPLNETGYVVWSKNQPDNAHHHGENCLAMNRNGFFNDVPCWIELPFICEHP